MSTGSLRFGLYEVCKEPNFDVWGVDCVDGKWPFFVKPGFLQEGCQSFYAILGVQEVR